MRHCSQTVPSQHLSSVAPENLFAPPSGKNLLGTTADNASRVGTNKARAGMAEKLFGSFCLSWRVSLRGIYSTLGYEPDSDQPVVVEPKFMSHRFYRMIYFKLSHLQSKRSIPIMAVSRVTLD
jgi:hypothetical protein